MGWQSRQRGHPLYCYKTVRLILCGFSDGVGWVYSHVCVCVTIFTLQVSPRDGLPAVVCTQCREQLDTCHRFRNESQRSQRKLHSFLQFANNLTGSPQVSLVFISSSMCSNYQRGRNCAAKNAISIMHCSVQRSNRTAAQTHSTATHWLSVYKYVHMDVIVLSVCSHNIADKTRERAHTQSA